MLEVGHLHCCKCTEVNAAKYYSTGNLIHGGEKRRGTRVFEEYVSIPASLTFLLILVNDLLIQNT